MSTTGGSLTRSVGLSDAVVIGLGSMIGAGVFVPAASAAGTSLLIGLAIAAVVVSLLVVTIDLPAAIGFSSFGVLLYYLVANMSAYTQSPDNRRYPRAAQILGAAGCSVLILTLPATSIAAGVAVLVVGVAYRLGMSGRRPRAAP